MVIGILKKILFYILLILIWEAIYKVGVDILRIWRPYTLPSPIDVFGTLAVLIKDNTIGIAIVASLKRLLVGYFISVVIGVTLGLTIAKFKYLEENLGPLILGLQTLPSICWLPFAILWFGLSESSIIFVIAIGSTFAVAISVNYAIKNVNPLYIRAARTMGAKGRKIYTQVILPAALPDIVSGLKQGWSFAWRALMAGEMLSSTKGLGQVLMVGRDLADISQVVAVMIVIIILGLLVDKLVFSRLEKSMRHIWGLDRV
ncbi:ABC transporter permease [Clostridium sp. CM027]|uniref:ABC transporter permease n=1 Tax=Clostridium sp. CM027 TaxID=2849865 RepID=UPI001C6E1BE2|nr:ABC transporter permease [Clostridium sp. CM027]MBW9146291.1 ABC transporter permease [Clostridium sp. CM027]UVE42628.1 ABC transporter permease [Clostridium sp. CM027]